MPEQMLLECLNVVFVNFTFLDNKLSQWNLLWSRKTIMIFFKFQI
jgi:hypothetical protein